MTQMYVPTSDKETAFAIFSIEARENPYETKKQGRPVFENIEYVEIIVPGSKDVFRQPASEGHKQRFAQQYAQFKARETQRPDGVPIDELSTATAAERATCKALNVLTVEALASYPDSAAHRLGPGAQALKRKAVAFLQSQKGASFATALQEENRTLRNEVAALKSQMTELLSRLPRKDDGERPADSRE
jgi:hypothetical protein